MHTHNKGLFEQIKTRISELQQSHVHLQEQYKNSENDFERNINDAALHIIDILDMIAMSILNMNNLSDTQSALLIIKKIEKRLINLLSRWHIEEIKFINNQIEPGKARVLETRKTQEEIPAGTIIEICRKGYQQNKNIIRPADVITSESHSTRHNNKSIE